MRNSTIRVVMFAGGGITHTSGGIGTLIRYLIDEWAQKPAALQVRVIDTGGGGGKSLMAARFARAALLFIGLRLAGKVDLVHLHLSHGGSALRKGFMACLGRLLGVPVIIHMHGSNFEEFYGELPVFCRPAMRVALNQARYVVVLGEAWKEFLVSQVGVQPQKIIIMVNGVPAPAVETHAEPPVGVPPHIAFLGRLGDRKGVPDLLAAFQLPQLRTRQWTATIAGDGEVPRFQTAVNAAGLAERVAIPGWLDRSAATALLSRSTIFVLPSHFEAMPIAILEAMAHGVAVVTTPVGAIPEFLTNERTALLVPPGAPDLLAAAIARLLDDPEERQKLAAAGRTEFADRFSIGRTAVNLLALYLSIVDCSPINLSSEAITPGLPSGNSGP